MISSIILMLITLGLNFVSRVMPNFISWPMNRLGLRFLYYIWHRGPNGMDDGIHEYLVMYKKVYSEPLLSMLSKSTVGSSAEEVALLFVEMVRGGKEYDDKLVEYANSHPDPDAKKFIESILPAQVGTP